MVKERAYRARLYLAFVAIYVVWGSTYLAIRYGIESFAPLRMMGVRSLIAGSILYGFGRLSSGEGLTAAQWRSALLLGTLFFVGGHGALAWGEKRIPSGVASLLVATIPVWLALMETTLGRGRLTPRLLLGLSLGFGGVVLLAEPGALLPGESIDLFAALVVLAGALSWALGTVVSRGLAAPKSAVLFSGASLLAGGGGLVLLSFLSGETAPPGEVSMKSVLAVLYLIVFGSIVGFVAYVWLLRVETASKVGTYAFVNPGIAVFLGWLGGGESLSARILLATVLMVAGVAIIVTQKAENHERKPLHDRTPMARSNPERESG
ncbi:MAG: EamA family transporter [Vicinamibacteria bacterium]